MKTYTKEELIELLIIQALNCIKTPGYREGALWRLIDAAGLLSKEFPESIGVKCGTGRHYKVVKD